MNCTEFSLILTENAGSPALPSELQEHARDCRPCQRLLQVLEPSTEADSAPETVRHVQQLLIRNLKPVRPLPSNGILSISFALIVVAVSLTAVGYLGLLGIAVRSATQLIVITGTAIASVAWLGYSLARHMVPGSSQKHHLLLVCAIPVVLCAEMLLLFQSRSEYDFWAHGRICLLIGVTLAGITALPCWVILRRGAVLSPPATGAMTGLVAGLAGTAVLETHCPNTNLRHILMSHLGTAAVSSLLGLLIGAFQEFRGSRTD